jgi:hypothetical protein
MWALARAIEAVTAIIPIVINCPSAQWRGGRVAEGGGLLNRCTVKSCTGGSNPPLSARVLQFVPLRLYWNRWRTQYLKCF